MEEPPNKKTKTNFNTSAANSISIGNLPREVLCIIFSYMDKTSMQNSTATCKLWFELIRGNPYLSSHIYFKIVKLQEFDERIQDLNLTGRLGGWRARWPVLHTVEFHGPFPYSFVSEKIASRLIKLVNPKECPTLEKIIINASYGLTRTFPQFPHLLSGSIKELTFNLKDDLKSIQVERVTKLSLVLDLKPHEFQEIQERTLTNGLKLIGSTAYNLKEIYVKFVSCFDTEKTKEDFQKSFRQMTEHLTKSLQKVQIEVKNLDYINTLFPYLEELTDLYVKDTDLDEFQIFLSFHGPKFRLRFKNLRKFHIDVNLSLDGSQLIEDDWMKVRLPQAIDKMFQDITDVKILFNWGTGYPKQTVVTVTKKPNKTTEVSN